MYKPHKMLTADADANEIFFDAGTYRVMTFLDPRPRVTVPLYETTGGTFYNPRPDDATYPQPWVEAMSFECRYINATGNDWYQYTDNTRTLREDFLNRTVSLDVYFQSITRERVVCVVTGINPRLVTNRRNKIDALIYTFTFRQIGEFVVL